MRAILSRLCAIVVLVCVVGAQSGCVTAMVMDEIFTLEGEGLGLEDSRPPSSAWLWKRIGLAGLVLPLTLLADLVVAATFGRLLPDDDDDDDALDECAIRSPAIGARPRSLSAAPAPLESASPRRR